MRSFKSEHNRKHMEEYVRITVLSEKLFNPHAREKRIRETRRKTRKGKTLRKTNTTTIDTREQKVARIRWTRQDNIW